MEAYVRYRAGPCVFCGEHSINGTVFLRLLLFSSVTFHQWSVFTFNLIILSSGGEADEAWLHSKETFFFWIVDGALNKKSVWVFYFLFSLLFLLFFFNS